MPQVLLYVPNLIGYIRLLLLASAIWVGTSRAGVTYWLFAVNMLLDGIDGVLARRLQQARSKYYL